MQIFCTESMRSDVVMMSVLMRLVILVCCAWSVKCYHSELESWSPNDNGTLHSMLLTGSGLRLVITGQTGVYNVDAVKFKLLSKIKRRGISNIIHNRTKTGDYVTVCFYQRSYCLNIDPKVDTNKYHKSRLKPPIKIDGVIAFMATNTKWAERKKGEFFLFVGCPHVQGQETLGGRCTEPGISWYLNSGKTKSDPWYGFKSYKDTPVLTDKYIDAFSVDKYRVFFSLQRVVTTGTKRSRIAQVCQNNNQKDGKDSTPYTYADMPIQCGQFREIRAVKKVVFQTEATFVAVFSESSKSAVCVFTMNNIIEMFAEFIKDCYRGIRIPKNEDYADYQDSDIPCSQAIADNDTFEKRPDYFLCNEDNLPEYRQVIGKSTLSSTPVVEYDDAELTAVAVSVLDSKFIATFGTANGAVFKAVIYPNDSAVKIWQPRVHNFGRDILHDMYSSPDDRHLYVLTRKRVFKLPVEPCLSYSSCDDCLQGGYPNCYWCPYERRCVHKRRRNICIFPTNDHGFCFKGKIIPAAVPTKDIQKIRLKTLVGMQYYFYESYCYVGYDGITLESPASLNAIGNELECNLDSSSIQSIENRTKGAMNVSLDVINPFVLLYQGQFIIYNCDTISRLSLCTTSNWTCKWCQYNGLSNCIDSNESCNTGSVEVKAGECPRVTNYTMIPDDGSMRDSNGTVYISRDRDYEINIAGIHLKDAKSVSYKCKIISDTQTLWFNNTQYDEDGSITCNITKEKMFSLSRPVDRLKVDLQVVWGDSPLGDTLPIIIYACENLVKPSSNCEQCKSLATYQPFLHCHWNGTSCIDSRITSKTTQCGDPEITKVYQLNVYSNDNTTVLIEGVNLAYKDAVNGVNVSGGPCTPIESLYEPGLKIWCELLPGSSAINGSVVITFTKNLTMWKSDPVPLLIPQVTSIQPTSGPMSGGTSVSLYGQHLNIGRNVTVTIGDNACILTNKIAPNNLICKTVGLISHITTDVTSKVGVKIDGVEVLGNLTYSYLEDPLIEVIHPKTSFASGGSTVTVIGRNMHVVKTPRLYSTIIEEKIVPHEIILPEKEERISELQNCTKVGPPGSVVLHCPTPRIPKFKSITREGLFARLGFEMDDVNSVTDYNLPSNVAYLRYFPDPKLKPVDNVQRSNTSHLFIEGDNLDLAANKSEIEVLIDCQPYGVKYMSSGEIVFELPPNRPDCSNKTELPLKVQIGYFSQIIGSVTFESTGTDSKEITKVDDSSSTNEVDSSSTNEVVVIALVVLVLAVILFAGIGILHVYRKYRAIRNQTRNNVEVREFQTVESNERRAVRSISTVSYAYARYTSGQYDYIRDADVVNTYLELSGDDPTYTKADEYVDPHPYRKLDNAEDQSEIKNDIPVNADSENKMEKNIQSDVMGTEDGVSELESDLDGGNIDPAHIPQNGKETLEESMSSANNDGNAAECSTSIDGGYIHAVWTKEINTGNIESTKIDGSHEHEAAKFKGAMDEKTLEGISPGQDCLSDMSGAQMHLVENQEFANGTCREKIVTFCGQEFETEENEGKQEEMTVEWEFQSRNSK